MATDKFDIVYPSVSMLGEPPVALVDKVVDRRGTREVAQAYLEYLYSPEGQKIGAKNYYRPQLKSVPAPFVPADREDRVRNYQVAWADGRKCSRRISPTAECSIRFIYPAVQT